MTEPRRRTSRRRSVRGRSTGSITAYGTKAGTRWRFQLSVPVDVARPEIGERKHSRAGFSSYEAADAELALLRADLMRKVPQPRGRDTFAAYGQRWLDGHAVGNGTRIRPASGRDGEAGQAVRHLERRATHLLLQLGPCRRRALGAHLDPLEPDGTTLRRGSGPAVGRHRLQQGRDGIERALHYDETLPLGERCVIGSVEGGRPRTVPFDRPARRSSTDGAKSYPHSLPAAVETSLPCSAFELMTRCFPRCVAAPQPSPDCTARSYVCRSTTARPTPLETSPDSPSSSQATASAPSAIS